MQALASAAPRSVRSIGEHRKVLLTGLAEGAFLALFPVVAVWLFNISIIDQEYYVDPEFYTGYGQSFARMWKVFGLTYYAARFPIMFLNTTTQWLLPGLGGYAVARLLIFLAAAIPLYLLVRRHHGRTVAVASYAFLLLNPLFPRVLGWDLTTSLSIPAGLSGIALWLLANRPWGGCAFAAGFMFATAVNSHVFTGTAIAVFLAIELMFSMSGRDRFRAFVVRSCTATAGAVTCMLLGLLFYRETVGPVSVVSLWQVTAIALASGRQYTETHYVPLSAYYATNYEIYVPLVTSAAGLILNRRRLFGDTVDARLVWFAVAYLAAYCISVFLLRMNIVQYFWYFGHLTIAVYLIIPVILARIKERAGTQAIFWFAGALAVVSLMVSTYFDAVNRFSLAAAGNGAVVMAILAAGTLAFAMLLLPLRAAVTTGAVLCAIVVQVPYLSTTHLGMYNRAANAREPPLVEIIRQYHQVLNRYDTAEQRVRTWYRTANGQLISVASSNLLFTLQSPWEGPGMPQVAQAERDILRNPTTRYVLLIDPEEAQLDVGLRALADAQVAFETVERYRWGYEPVRVSAVLIRLTR